MADRPVDPPVRDWKAMTLVDAIPPGATVLDVRWELGGPPGLDLYLDGHIPGAVFVDLDTALAGPPGIGGRHPLPDARVFEAAMRAAGVSSDRPVVVYDSGNSIAAARAWWLLRYFGHPDVRLLDGGFGGWSAAGNAIERAVTSPDRGRFRRAARRDAVARCRVGGDGRAGWRADRRPRARAVPRRARAGRPGGGPHPGSGEPPGRRTWWRPAGGSSLRTRCGRGSRQPGSRTAPR